MIIDVLLFTFLIYLVSVSPLPALPLIIASYAKIGFYGGFLSIIFAANLAILTQYYIGTNIRKNNFKWVRFEKLAKRYSQKIKKLSTLDLFLLRLSNIFITKIINLLLGFSGYPLKKLFIINNIALIPWQFLNYFFATKVDLLSDILLKINISVSISRVFSIISISCLVILLTRIIIFILKKITRNKYLSF